MSRADRTIAALTAQLENAARRIALMSNTALSFREIVRKYGEHMPGCKSADLTNFDEPPPCSCGWSKVEAFMSDDSNFGEVQAVRDIVVEDTKVILEG